MSWTVTVAVPVWTLLLLSVTVKVTVFAPTFAHVNELGETVTVLTPQESDEPLFTSEATIEAAPEALNWIVIFLVSTVGKTESTTVTIAVPVETLLLTSVTVNVTVFSPTFAHVNVLGETVIALIPQISVETLSTLLGRIEPLPEAFSTSV